LWSRTHTRGVAYLKTLIASAIKGAQRVHDLDHHGLLTVSVTRFEGELHAGDVLLFATTSDVGALVRKVEASPVNHCGIYVGDGEFLHTTWPEEGSCITRSRLAEEIDRMGIREISVRRVAAEDRASVVTTAEDYEAQGAAYAFNDLIMLSAVGELAARLGSTAHLVNQNLLTFIEWESLLQIHYGVIGDDSLTCSEFVQRCLPLRYQRKIEIQRPRSVDLPNASDESELWTFLAAEKKLNEAKFTDYRWVYWSLVTFATERLERAFTPTGEATDELVGWAVSAGLWVATQRAGDHRLSLDRLQWCLSKFKDQGAPNVMAELVSPTDFMLAADAFEPDSPTWVLGTD